MYVIRIDNIFLILFSRHLDKVKTVNVFYNTYIVYLLH